MRAKICPPRSMLLAISALAAVLAGLPAEPGYRHVVVDPHPPQSPWTKMTGDFNRDGKTDIAIAGQKGPLVWYASPGWQKRQIASGGWQTVSGAVGDVDGDGDDDIVPGAQLWFENPLPKDDPSAQAWTQHHISEIATHDVFLADLDRDGHPDLVGRDQSSFGHKAGNLIHFWKQAGPDAWQHHTIECPHGEGLAVADMDLDGDPDVIAGPLWFENDGRADGSWQRYPLTSLWQWADAKVAVGDLDGDGRADIALAPAELKGQHYRIAWYQSPPNPRDPNWPEHVVISAIESVVHGMKIADMNGDGRADIIMARMHQGDAPREVSVLLNGGKGQSWTKIVLAESGSHDILTADFNGDGLPDILGANHGGDYQAVELWLSPTSAR